MVGAHRGYHKDLTIGNTFYFMHTMIKPTWALPEYPYQPLNRARIDGSFDDGTDSRIVMAEQIPQDVVKQEQSVDDPSSTGVSATEPTNFAARAVLEKTSSSSDPEHDLATSNSLQTEPPVSVRQQVVDTEIPGFTLKPSAVAVRYSNSFFKTRLISEGTI